MFGGLTKTSSRIAIVAALGLTLGGIAFKATPAKAADLGGDCCADLEERVAELEATTVRKGNKKVSVTLSGWIVKSFNWWDDGQISSAIVGDKGYDLGSRFAITGSATIAPGWSGGYNLTMLATGDLFADGGTLFASNQFQETNSILDGVGGFDPLYSYMYIKSDTLGTLNWGRLSPASDNPAVLADISGTVIESNGVFFEGGSFFLRPKGGKGGAFNTLSTLNWGNFLQCQGTALGIGVDCFGAAQAAVRYDSPTWGGFRFETSWGKQALTGVPSVVPGTRSPDQNFWDIAGFYTGDWNSIKVSLAGAYTWMENSVLNGTESNLWQVGGSVMHKPSGLGIYAMGQWEDNNGATTTGLGLTNVSLDSIGIDLPLSPTDPHANITLGVNWTGGGTNAIISQKNQDTNAWYIKPFWRKAWSPIGATVLFGEYGQYNNQYLRGNLCSGTNPAGSALGDFCASTPLVVPLGGIPPELTITATSFPGDILKGAFVTDSEVQRYGLGVVQEIDSAAMHLYARWQHQSLDTSIKTFEVSGDRGLGTAGCVIGIETCTVTTGTLKQKWDDWDLFQVGGIIFF